MTPAELRAMSRLGGYAFAGLVSRIEQVHRAIGVRAFGSIGPVSAPVQLIHDSIARGAYRAVGSVGSAARPRRWLAPLATLVPLASPLVVERRWPC